ncbi:hypothetical protein [Rouxiella sp. Mn2063]|uniref:hypothetical protein n=1 Tax=Rouxiella sp. Mn2063 TaxID=3395262 RepID=UPI003BDC6CE0
MLSRDKTDYRKRLTLIEELRQVPGKESQTILLQMKEKDFVFSVRVAAWQALSEQGVVCPQPKEKSTFVVYLEKVSRTIKRVLKFLYGLSWLS